MVSPVWSNLYAPVTAVNVTGSGSTVVVVGDDGSVWQYTCSLFGCTWNQIFPTVELSGSMVSVSLSTSDGTLLGLLDNGNTYTYDGSNWNALVVTENPVVSASTGNVDDIVVVDNEGNITQYDSDTLTGTSLASSGPTQVTTVDSDNIWGTDSSGNVYVYDSSTSSWSVIEDISLLQVNISYNSSTYDLQTVGVDLNGNGQYFDGSSWSSIDVPSYGDSYYWVEANGAGSINAVTSSGVYTAPF